MVTIQPFIKMFVVNFTPSTEYDVEYYKVHAVHADDLIDGDFTPTESNLIMEGPDTTFSYVVTKGGGWFLKIAAVDTFGEDLLNYSQLYSVLVPSLDPLDQVPPGVPVFNVLPSGEETGIDASGAVDAVFIFTSWVLAEVPEDFSNYIIAMKRAADTEWNETVTTDSTYKFTNLVAGVSYNFKVKAVDKWNNSSAYSAIKTVMATVDTEAPAVVTGLTASAGMKKVIISFDPNREPDLSGYEIHVSTTNGFVPSSSTLIATGNSTLHSYEGTPDTTYYVKVRAYDYSGNFSDYTAQASAKTLFVVTDDLVNNIVTTAKLATDAVTTDILAANAVTTTELADGAVSSPKLIAGAVIAGKIAAGAVTATTIAAGAVTATTIAAGAVIAGNIAAGAVTATTIAAGAITSDKLTSGEVITLSAQIKDATITDAKIGTLTASKITTGTLSASSRISVGDAKIQLDGASSSITVANNAGTVTDMVTVGKLATGNYGISVKDKSGLQVFRVDESGATVQNLTAGTIDANKVTINNLVVGGNVTMGPSAYISWANVSSKPVFSTVATSGSYLDLASKPNTTYIGADGIYTGTLSANQVNASGFTAQSANIANAAITTAQIGIAQVDTLQIAGNAVTVPTTFTWSNLGFFPQETWEVAQFTIDYRDGAYPCTFFVEVIIAGPGSIPSYSVLAEISLVGSGGAFTNSNYALEKLNVDNNGCQYVISRAMHFAVIPSQIVSFAVRASLLNLNSPWSPYYAFFQVTGVSVTMIGTKR